MSACGVYARGFVSYCETYVDVCSNVVGEIEDRRFCNATTDYYSDVEIRMCH